MGFQIKDAKREKLHAKVLLSGASGSGKTCSALRLATGIQSCIGGEIVLINTEGERAYVFADRFKYKVIDLEAPQSPERYIEAIDFAVKEGASVIIIDSISHEWSYLNDMVNGMQGNSFNNWGKVKPRHKKMIEKIIQLPVHMIVTGRGKDEYVMEEKNGKNVPRKIGLGIQSEKDLEYEFQVSLNIVQSNHTIETMKDNMGLFENRYEPLTEKDGVDIFNWADKGETPAPKFDFEGARTQIIDLAKELGGSKDTDVSSIVNGVNPKKCEDEDILAKMLKELTKLKENRKEGEK